MVKVTVQGNALQMLKTTATFVGAIGDIAYYVLDGKAWTVDAGIVYRSEDSDESTEMINKVKRLKRHAAV